MIWFTDGATAYGLSKLAPLSRMISLTSFSGDSFVEVVATIPLKEPELEDELDFEFCLPMQPYSLQGKWSKVMWAIEFVLDTKAPVARVGFEMSPTGRAIMIGA